MPTATDRPRCQHCGQPFPLPAKGDPGKTCWRPVCRAMVGWTTADWEGRARMARARLAAGVDPAFPELDERALAVAGG